MRRLLIALLLLGILVACGDASTDDPQDNTPIPDTSTDEQNLSALSDTWTDTLLSEPFELDETIDFTLMASDGEAWTLSAQTDTITVIYFGFTSCPDVCPLTLSELRNAYEALGEPADNVQIVMITVDSERDTTDVLANYTRVFHDDFVGLTGDADQLEAAYAAFGVTAEQVEIPGSAMGYTVDHSAEVYIIPPDRSYARVFTHGSTASNYEHDLSIMLDNLDDLQAAASLPYATQLNGVAQDPTADPVQFTLTSTRDDADYTVGAQADQITVLYYGFTSCPDICPLTLYELSLALAQLGDYAAFVQVAMVTVDPERDTPSLLKNYVERFDASFIALYGDNDAIEAAKSPFDIIAFQREIEGSAMGYTIDHTADLFVLGPNGQYLLRIQHGTPYTDVAADLQVIIDNTLAESNAS